MRVQHQQWNVPINKKTEKNLPKMTPKQSQQQQQAAQSKSMGTFFSLEPQSIFIINIVVVSTSTIT
jgi:hypothetical protein